jgi:EAL domain-containing protein (putative c-di-GMP-specific phosphodiesterase class I)
MPLTMSVNVSGRQVLAGVVVADVARALKAADLEPSRLTLEFTESFLMQDAEASMTTMVELKKLGVRLAIDDFGTGYSSLSYLRRFPIDVLKIDRSFVETVTRGPEQSAVFRSMLKLGETLHLETVAEGVERPKQLARLRSLQVPLGQGFYFAGPLDPEGMRALLRGQAGATDQAESQRLTTEAAGHRPASGPTRGRELRAVAGPRPPRRHSKHAVREESSDRPRACRPRLRP